jgi:hypothetical protein
MKRIFTLFAIGVIATSAAQAQNVGIGTTTPDASAKLDVTSTTSGFLVPRMTNTQRDAIITPTKGLLVFSTTDNSFYYYDGAWKRLIPSGDNGYIQNGTAVQASANYAIQSANAASVVSIIKGAASQTADLTEWHNSAGTILAKVDAAGNITGTSFTGNGAGLTNLNGSNVSSGTVADARLTSNVMLLNAAQTVTGLKTITTLPTGTPGASGSLYINPATNGGAATNALLGLAVAGTDQFKVDASGNVTAAGTFSGNGSGLTALNASNVSSGTLNDARLSSNVDLLNAAQTVSGLKTVTATPTGTTVGTGSIYINPATNGGAGTNTLIGAAVGGTQEFKVDASGNIANAGNITAGGTISGNGSSLTNINASNITTGTLADARLSSNVDLLNTAQTFTAQKTFSTLPTGTTGTTAPLYVNPATNGGAATNALLGLAVGGTDQFKVDASGNVTANGTFTGNGSGLTALNASNISSGTLADGRLSTNVDLLNTAQTMSAQKTFGSTPTSNAVGGGPLYINPATNGGASTNTLIGAGVNGNTRFKVDAAGAVVAVSFAGGGAGLTNLNAGNIASGTLGVANGGTGATTLTGVLVGTGTTAITGQTASSGLQYLRSNAANTGYEFGSIAGVTADNGLNINTGSNVRLGGPLVTNTSIDQGSNSFTITNSGTSNTTVNLTSTGNFEVQRSGTSGNGLLVRNDGNVGVNTTTPTAKLDVNGTAKIGASGTVLNNILRASYNIAGITFTGAATFTVSVPGATVGGTAFVSPANALPNGCIIAYSRVSAANSVTFTLQTTGGIGGATISGDFYVTVIE